jgi:hypothetical protein
MFHSTARTDVTATTVFACATTGKFYLYYGQWASTTQPEEVYAFEGAFPSVEAFIEQADWNRMEQMKLPGWVDNKPSSKKPILPQPSTEATANIAPSTLPLTSKSGFRVAAHEP